MVPEQARCVRLYLDRPHPPGLDPIVLPVALEGAVPKRRLQFRAGRYCAMKAMEALDPRLAGLQPGRTAAGAPLWPDGIVGSITHTDDCASAAVAFATDALGIGIDTERWLSESQARAVGRLVAWPADLAPARDAGMTRLEALTLVFSAKEAVFKCLHPRVNHAFGFHDVRLSRVDATAGTFTVRIARTLSQEFGAGTVLSGMFALDGHWIHTGVFLAADDARSRGAVA